MIKYVLDVYSHYVKVTGFSQQGKQTLLGFTYKFAEREWERKHDGSYVQVVKCVYAASTSTRSEFRFHINAMESLLQYLKNSGVEEDSIQIHKHDLHHIEKVEFKINPKISLRDEQPTVVDYVTSDGPTKLITSQTGRGKGIMSMSACSKIGQRIVVVVQGMYIKKWVEELKDVMCLSNKDICVVRGSGPLSDVLHAGLGGYLTHKVIIISNKTLYNYIKEYEVCGGSVSALYPCNPDQYMEALGAGILLRDEIHLDFHFNFKLDLYTNCFKVIDMSATVETNKRFIERMYLVKYPPTSRMPFIPYRKYIAVKAVHYRMTSTDIRYLRRGRQSYSHVDFEKNIMRRKRTIDSYFSLIGQVFDLGFVAKKIDKQKCLIFFATVEMCKIAAAHLGKKYPDLKVGSYTQGDKFESLRELDVIVSTVKSAGTAVDIPDLFVVIQTVAIDSRQTNDQTIGRLREMKNYPGTTPIFYYLSCVDIPKHREYHENKRISFADKVLSHTDVHLQGGL